jgi:hypothetical protein
MLRLGINNRQPARLAVGERRDGAHLREQARRMHVERLRSWTAEQGGLEQRLRTIRREGVDLDVMLCGIFVVEPEREGLVSRRCQALLVERVPFGDDPQFRPRGTTGDWSAPSGGRGPCRSVATLAAGGQEDDRCNDRWGDERQSSWYGFDVALLSSKLSSCCHPCNWPKGTQVRSCASVTTHL